PAPLAIFSLSLRDALPISPFASRLGREAESGQDAFDLLPCDLHAGEALQLPAVEAPAHGGRRTRHDVDRRLLEPAAGQFDDQRRDRKSTRLNSSHVKISYA